MDLPERMTAIGIARPGGPEVLQAAEIAVPLASLGLTSPVGREFGFDLSVGVANPEGNRRDRAAHWGGLSEATVVDRPGSARLVPSSWGTIRFAPAAATAQASN